MLWVLALEALITLITLIWATKYDSAPKSPLKTKSSNTPSLQDDQNIELAQVDEQRKLSL